jgi:hypothetical protein
MQSEGIHSDPGRTTHTTLGTAVEVIFRLPRRSGGLSAFQEDRSQAQGHKTDQRAHVQRYPYADRLRSLYQLQKSGNSVSVGFTGKTTFYAAPEVIAALPRGTSQDVFSLGLVFQDMYWALHGNSSGRAMNPEGNHREGPWAGHKTSDEERAFAKNLPLLAFQCDAPELREEGLLVCLMRLMTAQAPVDRPTATTVQKCLSVPSHYGRLCGKCCNENNRRYDRETNDQGNWTRISGYSDSTTIAPGLGFPDLSMLAISNLPPPDSAQTDHYPSLVVEQPFVVRQR